jgi:hypothetical protein
MPEVAGIDDNFYIFVFSSDRSKYGNGSIYRCIIYKDMLITIIR